MRVKSTKSNCCLRLILDEVLICWVLEWWLILDSRNCFPLHFSWNLAEHMGILILYMCFNFLKFILFLFRIFVVFIFTHQKLIFFFLLFYLVCSQSVQQYLFFARMWNRKRKGIWLTFYDCPGCIPSWYRNFGHALWVSYFYI